MLKDTDIIQRVASRYRAMSTHLSFKYQPKETKQHKAERTGEYLKDVTGLQKGTAFAIADAFVRGRDVNLLATPKGWPIERGVITGPKGELPVSSLNSLL